MVGLRDKGSEPDDGIACGVEARASKLERRAVCWLNDTLRDGAAAVGVLTAEAEAAEDTEVSDSKDCCERRLRPRLMSCKLRCVRMFSDVSGTRVG
jgi:hypothetical protein